MIIQGFIMSRISLFTTLMFTLFIGACSSISGDHARWENIGTISNGNIKVFINKNSIKRNGNIVSFQDKKVVSNLRAERFVNTPTYKTAIADWEIHCKNKTYRLAAIQLFDERNTSVTHQSYTATDIRPMGIMTGTMTEKQYEIACGNKLHP